MSGKKKIGRTLKISVVSLLSVVFLFLAYHTLGVYRKPLTIKRQVPITSYNQLASSNYQVLLKPNNLYSAKKLDSDKIYIANFIDKIEANFRYRFNGDTESEVKGTYEVTALLEAYDSSSISSGNGKIKVWNKPFRLVAPTKFSYKGGKVDFVKTVPVNYNYFNQFCDAVNKAAGTSTGNIVLTVQSKIVTDAVTKKGIIHQVLTPNIVIPMGSKMFQIRSKAPDKKSDTLYTVENVLNPQLKKEKIAYTSASTILLAIIAFICFATKGVVEEPEKKMISSLMTKYGDRIIETVEGTMPETERVIRVSNFQNLVKVSDELIKPIFHFSHGNNGAHFFYIFDGSIRYECTIKPFSFITGLTKGQLQQHKALQEQS